MIGVGRAVWLGCLALSAGLESTRRARQSHPVVQRHPDERLGAAWACCFGPLWDRASPPWLTRAGLHRPGLSECPVPGCRPLALLRTGRVGVGVRMVCLPWLSPYSAWPLAAALAPFYTYFSDTALPCAVWPSWRLMRHWFGRLGIAPTCVFRPALLRMSVVWSLWSPDVREQQALPCRQPARLHEPLFTVMGGWLGCIVACRSVPRPSDGEPEATTKPSIRRPEWGRVGGCLRRGFRAGAVRLVASPLRASAGGRWVAVRLLLLSPFAIARHCRRRC